jgi:hypothetical protein
MPILLVAPPISGAVSLVIDLRQENTTTDLALLLDATVDQPGQGYRYRVVMTFGAAMRSASMLRYGLDGRQAS